MKVRFVQYNQPEFIPLAEHEMDAIPRRDETVMLGTGEKAHSWRVHYVRWTPGNPEYDALVVLVYR